MQKAVKRRKLSKNAHAEKGRKTNAVEALKGAFIALLITIGLVLALALFAKITVPGDEVISAVNQMIKIISIFVAAFVSSKKIKEKLLITGAMSGAIYILLGYLVFSLIEGRFGDVLLLFVDLAMGAVIGMLTALIFGKLLAKKDVSIKAK